MGIFSGAAEDTESQVGPWWLFLLTGIAWVLISFVLLGLKPGAVTTISFLLGFVLIFAGVNELAMLGYTAGWKWLRVTMGILFIISGILAFIEPFQTFGILALLIGWYLLFKGLFDVMISIVDREVIPLWGLLLAAGLFEMAIGFWALGYPGRSAWLLIIWVGIGALLRGVTDIVAAFSIHGRGRSAAVAAA
jgi:uncharacterized membrane protein HdeD (DUF308 family)